MYPALLAFVTVLLLAGALAVMRHRRRCLDALRHTPAPTEGDLPGVSVLKPLCGADDKLEENLASFFVQRYPRYELVFGVEGDADPAADVVRRLQARFPDVACRLVIHAGGRGINPKVSNLRAMLEAGSHDLVLISDSNVAVGPRYVAEMADTLRWDGTGLVTSLFVGRGERTLGAALENLHLNGAIAGAVALSEVAGGRTVAVGKSMLFRRSVFERLGGFESLATVLAEDYVMGRMFRTAGFAVRLAPHVVDNVCASSTVASFARRTLRWGAIRWRLKPLAYPFEVLSNPVAVALLAPLFGASLGWSLLWATALVTFRDAAQWWALRGSERAWIALLAAPKELLSLGVFVLAPWCRRIVWRGRTVRLSAGTRLYASAQMALPRRDGEVG
jgi:ceramide glucosyltransferase